MSQSPPTQPDDQWDTIEGMQRAAASNRANLHEAATAAVEERQSHTPFKDGDPHFG